MLAESIVENSQAESGTKIVGIGGEEPEIVIGGEVILMGFFSETGGLAVEVGIEGIVLDGAKNQFQAIGGVEMKMRSRFESAFEIASATAADQSGVGGGEKALVGGEILSGCELLSCMSASKGGEELQGLVAAAVPFSEVCGDLLCLEQLSLITSLIGLAKEIVVGMNSRGSAGGCKKEGEETMMEAKLEGGRDQGHKLFRGEEGKIEGKRKTGIRSIRWVSSR